jgi:sensor c-di-GMP phosphodiesterase-like protein
MARALGYDTVGEGVETPTQFAFLRLNGCTTAQGWYFGKPVPESDFVARLTADRGPAALDQAI